jgi:hypothetical protein
MYLYSKTAIPFIMHQYPQAKIIAMWRDPIDLAYSFHSQCLYGMEEDENDFLKAWQLQEDRQQGRFLPRLCNNPELLKYREIASLGSQFTRLFNVVPQNQIMIIDFKEFVANTAEIYQQVLCFLEVDDIGKKDFPAFNPNLTIKRNFFSKLVIKPPWPLNQIKRHIKKYWGLNDGPLTNAIRAMISQKTVRPSLPELTKKLIQQELAEDTKQFHELLATYNQYQIKKSA